MSAKAKKQQETADAEAKEGEEVAEVGPMDEELQMQEEMTGQNGKSGGRRTNIRTRRLSECSCI